jgi:OOP family OmpA-OmpF porin
MKKIALVSTLGLMVSLPVFAGEKQSYVAVDIGRSAFGDDANTPCVQVAGTVGASCKQSDTAYRFSAGYGFTDNFGIEAGYGNYGKTSVTGTVGGAASTGSIKATAFQVVGTGAYAVPVVDKLSLTAKAGLASINAKGTATGGLVAGSVLAASSVRKTNFVWGIGAEYALTPTVALRADFEDLGTIGNATTIGTYKLTAFSVGAMYKF